MNTQFQTWLGGANKVIDALTKAIIDANEGWQTDHNRERLDAIISHLDNMDRIARNWQGYIQQARQSLTRLQINKVPTTSHGNNYAAEVASIEAYGIRFEEMHNTLSWFVYPELTRLCDTYAIDYDGLMKGD